MSNVLVKNTSKGVLFQKYIGYLSDANDHSRIRRKNYTQDSCETKQAPLYQPVI